MLSLTLILIFAVSYIVFGVTGFGSGLVAMPLLSPLIGIETAAPLFAIVALVSEIIMLARYRRSINLHSSWRLIIATSVATPLGIAAAHFLPQNVALWILGIVVTGYGLYSLFSPRVPEVANPNWGYGFGFLAGILSGAYNTGGPPIVIYGSLSRWPPDEFKSSLQTVFIFNSLIVIGVHTASGHMTSNVLQDTLVAAPAMLIGLLAGWFLEKRVNPAQFRKIVLIVLVIIGLNLITSNWIIR